MQTQLEILSQLVVQLIVQISSRRNVPHAEEVSGRVGLGCHLDLDKGEKDVRAMVLARVPEKEGRKAPRTVVSRKVGLNESQDGFDLFPKTSSVSDLLGL